MIFKKYFIGVTVVLLLFNMAVLFAPEQSTSKYYDYRKQMIVEKLSKLDIQNDRLATVINETISDEEHIDIAIAIAFKESRTKEDAISPDGHDHGAWQMNDRYHKFDKKKILTYGYACRKFINFYTELESIYPRHKAIKRYNGSGLKSQRYAEDVISIIQKLNS